MAAPGNLVIPNRDYLRTVRYDYNQCKDKALRACDSAAKAQGRVARNLYLAQGKNAHANPMPRPLHLRRPMHIAAAEVIRQAAQGGRRKRRKTRRHKKRRRRRKSTRKSKKSGTKKRRKSRGAKNKKRR